MALEELERSLELELSELERLDDCWLLLLGLLVAELSEDGLELGGLLWLALLRLLWLDSELLSAELLLGLRLDELLGLGLLELLGLGLDELDNELLDNEEELEEEDDELEDEDRDEPDELDKEEELETQQHTVANMRHLAPVIRELPSLPIDLVPDTHVHAGPHLRQHGDPVVIRQHLVEGGLPSRPDGDQTRAAGHDCPVSPARPQESKAAHHLIPLRLLVPDGRASFAFQKVVLPPIDRIKVGGSQSVEDSDNPARLDEFGRIVAPFS